jgi:AcrR family transcriptional regulator
MNDGTEAGGVARPEPPWWRPEKTTGRRRQPLTRQAIVDAAVKIVDAEGVDALTVRRLGQALDTGSATLYWYVRGKDELAELVYDHVMGEVELPEPDPAHWQDQLKTFAFAAYRVLLRHNDLVRLSLGRIPVGPNMLRVMEWNLALLRGAGMSDQLASYVGDIFGRYLDASVLEVVYAAGQPPEVVFQYFASLPTDQFPNMHALSRALGTTDNSDEARFGFGLDLFVRGLESLINEAT